ncbi:T9SS type A sorting domain-containing protein [candidate division KSB1 bacterium]|nr:T9SS type A sorting domain-containing protein [candidate division KSB1 bacterium]
MKKIKLSVGVFILITGSFSAILAEEQFAIPYSVFGAGGGRIAGGNFAVAGTIGQSATGVLNGPEWIHKAGFWFQSGGYFTDVKPFMDTLPTEYRLEQNYPNPFNPATTISFSLPQREFVDLTLYDLLGRQVSRLINKSCQAGIYSVVLNGESLSSGTYIYRLRAGDFVSVKKLLLLK